MSALPTHPSISESAPNSKPAKERKEKFTNRLATEQSPYLLQHAHNPVNWYPWGDEAIEKAKKEEKIIFLSVGYSTCHWCHVMEHESFENENVANIMNQLFISIKVDKEERPDVDRMYMRYVTAISGRGGWPMSVFLTPDLTPVFGGTYFPSRQFLATMMQVSQAWQTNAPSLKAHGADVIKKLKLFNSGEAMPHSDMLLTEKCDDILEAAYKSFDQSYDAKLGGFGKAPKFPRPVEIKLLLAYYDAYAKSDQQMRSKHALTMALHTLKCMARGGIYDIIGGGFARYSVDECWHVPHFEKMLYDNAQLVNCYLDAYRITKDCLFSTVAQETLEYIIRDMTHPNGGVFSAEDADSLPNKDSKRTKEGRFYVWTETEIETVLSREESNVFKHHFYIKNKGNADLSQRSDPHGEFAGLNILYQKHSIEATAKSFHITNEAVDTLLKSSRKKLFQYRNERKIRPHLDDKIIVSWNGLIISAFSNAYKTLSDAQYLKAAISVATFIRDNLTTNDGHLLRSYRSEASNISAFCADYSNLIDGLLHLYEAAFDPQWLKWAIELQSIQNQLFWDDTNGGYFESLSDDQILIRNKEDYDGAEPSANSVAIGNLLRLHSITRRSKYLEWSESTLKWLYERMETTPNGMPLAIVGLNRYLRPYRQIILCCQKGGLAEDVYSGNDEKESSLQNDTLDAFRSQLFVNFHPNIVVLKIDDETQCALAEINKQFNNYSTEGSPDKQTTVLCYVCDDKQCYEPTTDPSQLVSLLL